MLKKIDVFDILINEITIPATRIIRLVALYFSTAMDRAKQKSIHFQVLLYLILAVAVSKILVSGFRRNLGCARYAQSWVFFQNFQNTAFLLLFYSVSKKATEMVFIRGDRGYSAVRFEYKTASERYFVAELQVNSDLQAGIWFSRVAPALQC